MPEEKKWKWWHTAILLIIIAVIVLVSEVGLDRRLTWVIVLGLLTVFAVIAGHGVTGYWRGIVIDDRHKVSLSRLQMLIWTILAASGFLSAALLNISLGGSSALDINIPEQLLWLMGISTTSLVGSPLIKNTKKTGEIHTKESAGHASWIDIFMGEEKGDQATVDLAKVQMFFITLVVVLAYAIAMGTELSKGTAIISLPPLDGSIVGLLGISHAGYLSSKGMPKGKGGKGKGDNSKDDSKDG